MNPRDLFRELFGVLLLGATVFLLVSVISFDPADLSYRVVPANPTPSNWGGRLGAWLGAFLLEWVGALGALATGLLVGALGWSCVRPKPDGGRVEPLRRVAGAVVVVLCLSVLERAVLGGVWSPSLARGFAAGGTWGVFLEAELGGLLGGVGMPLALAVTCVVGAVLTCDRPLRDLANGSFLRARAAVDQARETVAAAEDALANASPTEDPAPVTTTSQPAPRPAPIPAPSPAADATADEVDGALLPTADLLTPVAPTAPRPQLDSRAKRIEETLAEFKLTAKVMSVEHGPAVTLFGLELGRGIKVQRLAGLLDNLAIALRVPGIRLQAPIPGTSWVGLEVPNEDQEVVGFRELFEFPGWRKKDPALPLFLGKDSAGRPLIADLAKMPHLLIAGATGAGKSVCINSIILSLLMCRTQREAQLILIDPKQVELQQFAKVPHLLHPVVTDMRQAGAVLAWAVKKMEQRYTWLANAGVRHIKGYNQLGKDELANRLEMEPEALTKAKVPWHLPYIVLVVDELNDLMMIAQKEVEASIMRLAQKSRAVGIHVILATQRPSVDVITGVIKSNLPSRIAFRVTSKVDSRTILDMGGAEKLLGQGDMLFLPPGRSQPIRTQGAFVTDKEVRAVVKAVSRGQDPDFNEELREATENAVEPVGGAETSERDDKDRADPTYRQAIQVVLGAGKGSVSLIQRKLQIGYSRAARLLDLMAEDGIVGPARGSKPREINTTLEEWEGSQAA
jgi:S-DNA-T family DNA segregation ATPase FtsK/SpoIIIE